MFEYNHKSRLKYVFRFPAQISDRNNIVSDISDTTILFTRRGEWVGDKLSLSLSLSLSLFLSLRNVVSFSYVFASLPPPHEQLDGPSVISVFI